MTPQLLSTDKRKSVASTVDNRFAAAVTDHERTALARQIEHTDVEIDRLVYELYGLTEEEITLVEGVTAS